MFGTLGAHSTAAVRSAPRLAQLSAAAVLLGCPGGNGTKGSEPSARSPTAFVRADRRSRHKAGDRICGEDLGTPWGPWRKAPLPRPAAGGSGAWTVGQQTVRGRQREPHGKRRLQTRPPARSAGSPGASSPFPRRLLPLALTFRDGLRRALLPLEARAPSRRRGDAGGEAEPPSPGGTGSAALHRPGAAAGGRVTSKGQAGPAPPPLPRAGCGLVALEESPRLRLSRRRIRCAAASSHMEPPRRRPPGPVPAPPPARRRVARAVAPAPLSLSCTAGAAGPRLQRQRGRQGPSWATRRGSRMAGLGAAAAPFCSMWEERRLLVAGPGRGCRARWGKQQQQQQHPGIRSLPAAPGGGGEGGRETERARRWRGQMTAVTRQRGRPRPSAGAER